jgi:hypothetical protein
MLAAVSTNNRCKSLNCFWVFLFSVTSPRTSHIEFHSSNSHTYNRYNNQFYSINNSHRYKTHIHKYKLKYNINNHNKCIYITLQKVLHIFKKY